MNGRMPAAEATKEAISTAEMELMPIPQEPEEGLILSEPQSFMCETEGEGFRDKRMFTVVSDGKSWKATAAWQAEGSGPPPLIAELFNPHAMEHGFLGLANNLMNMILCPGSPTRQATSFGRLAASQPPVINCIGRVVKKG